MRIEHVHVQTHEFDKSNTEFTHEIGETITEPGQKDPPSLTWMVVSCPCKWTTAG